MRARLKNIVLTAIWLFACPAYSSSQELSIESEEMKEAARVLRLCVFAYEPLYDHLDSPKDIAVVLLSLQCRVDAEKQRSLYLSRKTGDQKEELEAYNRILLTSVAGMVSTYRKYIRNQKR